MEDIRHLGTPDSLPEQDVRSVRSVRPVGHYGILQTIGWVRTSPVTRMSRCDGHPTRSRVDPTYPRGWNPQVHA